jgi:hypothetical protein
MSDEFEILRKLNSGSVTEEELMDFHYKFRDSYRVQLNLVMHPKFPQRFAINIISHLYAVDLIRVSKNKRTSPLIRQKAEFEFKQKYARLPLGEKLSYVKIAPYTLLLHFVEEQNIQVVEAMLGNPYCTEDLVMRFINRNTPRHGFYEALQNTEWYKRPAVAEAIAADAEAPIRMMIEIIPYLGKHTLRKIYENEETHDIVKKNIIDYYKNTGNRDS